MLKFGHTTLLAKITPAKLVTLVNILEFKCSSFEYIVGSCKEERGGALVLGRAVPSPLPPFFWYINIQIMTRIFIGLHIKSTYGVDHTYEESID